MGASVPKDAGPVLDPGDGPNAGPVNGELHPEMQGDTVCAGRQVGETVGLVRRGSDPTRRETAGSLPRDRQV